MLKSSPRSISGGAVMAAVLTLLLQSGSADGAITGWDFEDGTLQGWTNVSVSTTGPLQYAPQTNNPPDVAWEPLGYRTASFGYMAAAEAFGARDAAQDAPLVLRSPAFQLVGGGAISVHALGGTPGAIATVPTNFSDLAGPSYNTNGNDEGGDASYLGVALRRESDGAYLLTRERTGNSSGYFNWQNLLFTEADLAPIIAGNPGEMFTLDVIDTAHGSFGSLAIDGVTIPAAAPTNIFQGGGMWHVQERLSAGDVNNIADALALFELPVDDPGVLAEVTTDTSVINYFDFLSSPGRFEGDDVFLAGQNSFATRITGNIHITESGPVTFGFHANDGGILRINGQVVAQDSYPDLASDTFGSINLVAGVHAVEFIYYQDAGGASVELFAATTLGEFTSFADGVFDLLVATDMPLPEGIPGDYNNDHVVDARDYVVWRNALDTATVLPNDSTPGVTIDDYDVWRQHFGMSSSGSGALLSPAQVPEPSTFVVVSGALGLAWGAHRRFQKARHGN
jgi:hypothetical protein